MIDRRLLTAVGGFAFVAAWIGFGFGQALLCVLGAAICWLGAGIVEGKVDLGKLQRRFGGEEEAPGAPGATSGPARPAGRSRVQ